MHPSIDNNFFPNEVILIRTKCRIPFAKCHMTFDDNLIRAYPNLGHIS